MNAVPPPTTWRVLKCWQEKQPVIVWQLTATGVTREQSQKTYLVLDGRQDAEPLTFTPIKPNLDYTKGNFTELWRKIFDPCQLEKVLVAGENHWLQFRKGGAQLWVALLHGRPPEIVLIDHEHVALLRFSLKGTFTKRKTWEGDFPPLTAPLEDITAKILLPASPSAEPTQAPAESAGSVILSRQKELARKLKRRLKTLRKTHEEARSHIPSPGALEQAQREANALQAYLYLVQPGQNELIIPDESALRIPLNPDMTPGKNLERSFHQLKRLTKAQQLGAERVSDIAQAIRQLETTVQALQTESWNPTRLDQLAIQYHLREQPKKPSNHTATQEVRQHYRTFISAHGPKFYVGKNAADNDVLTKQARAQDYWVHAVQGSGSHVIIPGQKSLAAGQLPAVLREAAILALHFSQFRQDQAGEVYVTKRANLRKPKGLAPGLWLVDRSERLFVRYESAELQTLLQSEKI